MSPMPRHLLLAPWLGPLHDLEMQFSCPVRLDEDAICVAASGRSTSAKPTLELDLCGTRDRLQDALCEGRDERERGLAQIN